MILFEKFGQHQPLNRQSERYAREGVELSLSTLADQVGACATILRPLHALIEAHVLAAERLHGDGATVPILAKGKTDVGRIWVYVRDDKPFCGQAPPAALFYASRTRAREHPERRLASFEREINGLSAERRQIIRQERSAPLARALEDWMRTERARLSRHADVAKAIDYTLTRWPAFTRFLDDGRICLTNNAAERPLRGIALGRKSWLFAGSERGAERAVVMYTLIQTAKMNDVDPQAWLADVLARIAEIPQNRLADLLPWNWAQEQALKTAA